MVDIARRQFRDPQIDIDSDIDIDFDIDTVLLAYMRLGSNYLASHIKQPSSTRPNFGRLSLAALPDLAADSIGDLLSIGGHTRPDMVGLSLPREAY